MSDTVVALWLGASSARRAGESYRWGNCLIIQTVTFRFVLLAVWGVWRLFRVLPNRTMANFGELVLVLGDAHIPQRASKISEGFQRMLVPNKMQHVVCTGNCQGIAEDLEGLAPNIHIVADENCDESVPETKILQVGAFRIGIIHGHQILPWKSSRAVEVWRRKLQVDILITGHSHQQCFQVFNNGRSLHLNPVSALVTSIMLHE